jgi:hypothetical protein
MPEARQLTDIETRILDALQSLKYGSLEVLVHDSKIVQLERKEKQRFEDQK